MRAPLILRKQKKFSLVWLPRLWIKLGKDFGNNKVG